MRRTIRLKRPDGGYVLDFYCAFAPDDGDRSGRNTIESQVRNGKVWINRDLGDIEFAAFPDPCGFWSPLLKLRADQTEAEATLQALPHPVRGSWWRRHYGLTRLSGSSGAGVRIAVIDEGVGADAAAFGVGHVTSLGPIAFAPGVEQRSLTDETGGTHSVEILNLLTGRNRRYGPFGLAPGAEILFATAPDHRTPAKLNTETLARTIETFSKFYAPHLILFCAGDSETPLQSIDVSVKRAFRRGALCIAAAGNKGGEALFPARYDSVFAVGASGVKDSAPPGTVEQAEAGESHRSDTASPHVASLSARGNGVNAFAPGENLVIVADYGPSHSVSGTSYAAPIAAGLAARELSNHPEVLRMKPDVERARKIADVVDSLYPPLLGTAYARKPFTNVR